MNAHRSEIPTWEALALVDETSIGRLCVIDHGTPVAFPVNFRMIGEDDHRQLVVRTTPTTLIGSYSGPASMEIDHIDVEAMTAWSVIMRGELRPVSGGPQLPDPHPWLDSRHHWLLLDVSAVSGRRFVGTKADDGYSVEWQLAI